jgi:hypothetical protein
VLTLPKGGRGNTCHPRILADQLRADHRSILLDQAAVGLMRKEELREPGHTERIDEPSDDRLDDDHHDSRADLSQHGV